MEITTRLQRKYTFRVIAIALVSIVLGVWGLIDYVYWIPYQKRAVERRTVCEQIQEALASGEVGDAQEAVEARRTKLRDRGIEAPASEALPTIESVGGANDETWLVILGLFAEALAERQTLGTDGARSSDFQLAASLAKQGINELAEFSAPSTYDPYIKGLVFVPCLPMGLYFFWILARARRKVYRLDEDGTLHTPMGMWTKGEIADIDMTKWMSKSIAHVVHLEGHRIKLDDYIYQNVHLIVGAMASVRYPDEWDEEARIKKAKVEEPSDDEADSDSEATEEPESAEDERTASSVPAE